MYTETIHLNSGVGSVQPGGRKKNPCCTAARPTVHYALATLATKQAFPHCHQGHKIPQILIMNAVWHKCEEHAGFRGGWCPDVASTP